MTDFSATRLNEDTILHHRLDNRDEKILSVLSANSRETLSAISKRIRLSKEGTLYRVNKLKKLKIIIDCLPVLDLRDFGYNTYHVFMVINEINPMRKKEFLAYLISYPNTKAVMEYSDRWDLEWVLIARDVQEFDNILNDVTRDFLDIINERNNFEIILGYKSIQFPDPYYQGNVVLTPKKRLQDSTDDTDLEILRCLSRDARFSTYEISRQIKMSPDAISYRIKKMEKNNLIRQFTILPNLSMLGYHWYTMCMNVRTFDLRHEMKFKAFISARPQIIRAVKLLGDWDIMIHIVTKEVSSMHNIVKEIHRSFVDVIINYQTWGAYKEHYYCSIPQVIFDNIGKKS